MKEWDRESGGPRPAMPAAADPRTEDGITDPRRTMSPRRCRIRHRQAADVVLRDPDGPLAGPAADVTPPGPAGPRPRRHPHRSPLAALLGAAVATGLTAACLLVGCHVAGDADAAPSALAAAPSTAPETTGGGGGSTAAGDVASPGAAAESAVLAGELSREAWSYAGREGHLIRTANYRIHTTIRYDNVVERLPRFMEAALEHYRTAIVDLPPPPEPLHSFIFHDREEWEAKTVEVIPQQAGQLRGLGRGGFSTRGIAVLYYLDWSGRSRDTLAIAAHEGWHQYTQRTFRDQLPLWLEEGIATYMEGHRWGPSDEPPQFSPRRNWERWSALRSLVRRDRLIPLRDLVSRAPQEFLADGKNDLLAYYAQVWALTHFLVRHDDGKYRPFLERVLLDATAGDLLRTIVRSPRVAAAGGRGRALLRSRVGPWLLLAYFTEDLRAFEEEFEQYCRDMVRMRRR